MVKLDQLIERLCDADIDFVIVGGAPDGSAEELLHAWEQDFCSAGLEVDRLRAHYVDELRPHFEALAARLVGPDTSPAFCTGPRW